MERYEWTDKEDKTLLELKDKGKSSKEIADELTKLYNFPFTAPAVRGRYQRIQSEEQPPDYKETIEILHDGSHKSDKLLKMSSEQAKDVNYLLQAHGFSTDEWELVTAKNNIWNTYSKQDGIMTLYASKITVKPQKNSFQYDKLLTMIEKRPPKKPIVFRGYHPKEPTYLEIPFFDLHFRSLEYYEKTLQDTLELLDKPYKEVLFIVGQDLFHNDNFKGTTANGTVIDKVDMEKSWDDAETFYITLIDKALSKSEKVVVIYSKGNHDESMAWAFAKNLESVYRKEPRITFDNRFKERKAYMLGFNFIGTTHGDKNRKNVAANFSIEFPEMWSKATTREVHMGHLHRKRTTVQPTEITIDEKGVIVRELGTGNETDQYHEDNGYNMAHKEFEIFEYTEKKKKHIHYV